MHMLSKFRSATISALVLLFALTTAAPLLAQQPPGQSIEPVSDTELENFVIALEGVQEVQAELQEEIDSTIGNSNLSEEQFYQIHEMAQQTPGEGAPQGVDRNDFQEYQTTISEISETQQSSQTEMVEMVEETGLSVSRFNEIIAAAGSDEELRNRLDRYMD